MKRREYILINMFKPILTENGLQTTLSDKRTDYHSPTKLLEEDILNLRILRVGHQDTIKN